MAIRKNAIEHIKQLSGSDAHFPAIKAYVELVEAGHGHPGFLPFAWNDRAILARSQGKIVGLIVWRYTEWTREASILMGWVNKAVRCQGIYRRLYKATKAEAKKLGALHISGSVSPANKAIRATSAKLGRKETCITLSQKI